MALANRGAQAFRTGRGVKGPKNRGGHLEVRRTSVHHAILGLKVTDIDRALKQDFGRVGLPGSESEPDEALVEGALVVENSYATASAVVLYRAYEVQADKNRPALGR